MGLEDVTIPWIGAPVRRLANLYSYFAARVPREMASYLPGSITLFFDAEIEVPTVAEFIFEMSKQLGCELHTRVVRRDRFVELGLISQDKIESFLTSRRHIQPWAIYYSHKGGLRLSDEQTSGDDSAFGVIPCSSMRNHGVAWNRTAEGRLQVWLATARKEGHDWDWDSDIGHESAHAAFAPVPLFAQGVQQNADCAKFSDLCSAVDLDSGHLARIAYIYSEIAVVAIRGESRPTETGLPIAEKSELFGLLELSDELMPSAGFKQALDACARVNGFMDVKDGNEIFELAAPVMRIVPYLTTFVRSTEPPPLAWFRMINYRIA